MIPNFVTFLSAREFSRGRDYLCTDLFDHFLILLDDSPRPIKLGCVADAIPLRAFVQLKRRGCDPVLDRVRRIRSPLGNSGIQCITSSWSLEATGVIQDTVVAVDEG